MMKMEQEILNRHTQVSGVIHKCLSGVSRRINEFVSSRLPLLKTLQKYKQSGGTRSGGFYYVYTIPFQKIIHSSNTIVKQNNGRMKTVTIPRVSLQKKESLGASASVSAHKFPISGKRIGDTTHLKETITHQTVSKVKLVTQPTINQHMLSPKPLDSVNPKPGKSSAVQPILSPSTPIIQRHLSFSRSQEISSTGLSKASAFLNATSVSGDSQTINNTVFSEGQRSVKTASPAHPPVKPTGNKVSLSAILHANPYERASLVQRRVGIPVVQKIISTGVAKTVVQDDPASGTRGSQG
jgi:hypothetical protein